jgi:hypothetical protein
VKITLSGNWFDGPDVGLQAGKTLVIGLLVEAAIKSRRGDFKKILVWNRVLDIKNQAKFLADPRTIVERHTTRLVNEDLEHWSSNAGHLGVNQFYSLAGRGALNYLLQSRFEFHRWASKK